MSKSNGKTPVEAATSTGESKNLPNDSLNQPITLRQALVNEIFEHMLDKVIFGYREDIVTVDSMTFEDMEIICAHFELSLNQILECVKGDFK